MARIAILVAGVLLLVLGIVRLTGALSGAGSSSSSASDSASSLEPASVSTSASAQSSTGSSDSSADPSDTGTASDSATSGADTSDPTAAEELSRGDVDFLVKDYTNGRDLDFMDDTDLTDDYGNPTLYAFSELEGWQLMTLAEYNTYVLTMHNGTPMWYSERTGIIWNVGDVGGFYEDDETAALAKGAEGTPTIFSITVPKTDLTGKEVYEALSRCTTVCSTYAPRGEYVAVCYGPSERKMLVVVSPVSEGSFLVFTFNEEAVSYGFFDQLIGDGKWGSTPEEVFESFTGKGVDTQE